MVRTLNARFDLNGSGGLRRLVSVESVAVDVTNMRISCKTTGVFGTTV